MVIRLGGVMITITKAIIEFVGANQTLIETLAKLLGALLLFDALKKLSGAMQALGIASGLLGTNVMAAAKAIMTMNTAQTGTMAALE